MDSDNITLYISRDLIKSSILLSVSENLAAAILLALKIKPLDYFPPEKRLGFLRAAEELLTLTSIINPKPGAKFKKSWD